MSTPEGRKSPKHERVTRATAAATAAAASKAPAQTAAAAAPKALEEMASMAPEQTVSKAKDEDSDDNSRIDRLETDIKILQRTNSILLGEINELKKLITVLSRQVKALTFQQSSSSRPGPSKPPSRPVKAPKPETSAHDFKGLIEKGLTSELTKKALSFPESARLKGISNYEQWYKALRLTFKAYNLEGFLNDINGFNTTNSQIQTMLLLLIKESLSPQITASITWIDSPEKALNYITNQYNHQENTLRNSLYKEFHALKLSAKRPVEGFNSAFNKLLNRLTVLGVIIDPKDVSNQYINTVEKAYPAWAERQRSALRQAMALGFSVKRLNLPYLQGDLAADNRANKPYYNQGQGQD